MHLCVLCACMRACVCVYIHVCVCAWISSLLWMKKSEFKLNSAWKFQLFRCQSPYLSKAKLELIKALEHIRLGLHYQQTSGSELFSKRFYFTPSSITYFTDNMKIMVLQTETEMLPPPPPKKKKKRRKKKREWPLRAGGKKGGGGEVFKIPEVNEPEVISLDQEHAGCTHSAETGRLPIP